MQLWAYSVMVSALYWCSFLSLLLNGWPGPSYQTSMPKVSTYLPCMTFFQSKSTDIFFSVSCSQDRYSFPSKLMFGIDMPHTHTYSSLTLLSWCANGSCYFNVLMSSSNETYFINERRFYSLVLIISRLNSFEVMCQFAAIYINKCWNLCICFFMQY